MTALPRSAGTAGTRSTHGAISGQVLQAVRESLGLTQEQLAEHLQVDVNTLKGWETGRRPLAQVKVRTLLGLGRRLKQLGAATILVDHLEVAIEADLFVDDVLQASTLSDPHEHTLAKWVSTRGWNDLLAWTFTGATPSPLRDYAAGRRQSAPPLSIGDRERFFDQLRTLAERTLTHHTDEPAGVLLRRQVYFMTAWDRSSGGHGWLSTMENQEIRRLRRQDSWTPTWAASRSLAVARACQGDPEQLRHFIATQLADDRCEAANLNYWAYWIGENTAEATGDAFMAVDLGNWRGTALLRHLVRGLEPSTLYLELSVHSVWALVSRRPYLLDDDPALTDDLQHRVTQLLDDGGLKTELAGQSRRELEQLAFAARMARRMHQ